MSEEALPRTPGDYLKASRAVENGWKVADRHPLRLAVLASFTADFIRPFVVVAADALGLAVRPWFGPFGQFEQLVLAPGSALWVDPPGAIWLAMRIEDVDPQLLADFPRLSPPERGQ